MSNVNIYIEDAVVTEINEFNSRMGYGADFFIEAKSSNCTVYFQVVTYDDEARSYCRYIHKGNHVMVTGDLKDKVYRKKDGTEGHALIIERPQSIRRTFREEREPQEQRYAEENIESSSTCSNGATDAVTAPTVTAPAVTASAVIASAETNKYSFPIEEELPF